MFHPLTCGDWGSKGGNSGSRYGSSLTVKPCRKHSAIHTGVTTWGLKLVHKLLDMTVHSNHDSRCSICSIIIYFEVIRLELHVSLGIFSTFVFRQSEFEEKNLLQFTFTFKI